MTTRMYAHASAAAAILLAAAACYAAVIGAGWPALGGLYTTVFFTWSATRCYDQARREQTVEQLLGRLTPDDDTASFELPPPCCSFWLHTDGEVHGPDCTRPAAARTTLAPAEQQAFAQIAQAFHRTGGAA